MAKKQKTYRESSKIWLIQLLKIPARCWISLYFLWQNRLRKRVKKVPSRKVPLKKVKKKQRQNSTRNKVIESNNEASNIDSLPDEMLIKIFRYFSQNKLGQISRVCRRWRVLTWSPVLWKKVNVEFYKIHGSQNSVTKCFVNLLPHCVTFLRLNFKDRRGWNQPLNFREFSMKIQEKCPHLQTLILYSADLSDNLPSIIDLCTEFLQDVKSLIFHCSRFSRSSTTEFSGTSKIKVLDLIGCNFHYLFWCSNLNKPPFSRMTHLKELRLSSRDVDDSWLEDNTSALNQLHILDMGRSNISSKTFEAIRSYGLHLKELYLCRTYIHDNDLNFNNLVFPHLKTICLKLCAVTCEGVVSLILSCPSLENIYVDEEVAQSCAEHPFIVSNKSKLEMVKVISCYDHRKVENFCE